MNEQEGKDRQGCILLSGFLDSVYLFPPFSATILMYSFGFEELDPGEWSVGITKVEGGVFWRGLVQPDSVNVLGCGLAYWVGNICIIQYHAIISLCVTQIQDRNVTKV